MAFKTTGVVLTTSPILIAGSGSTIIDTVNSDLWDPVVCWFENQSASVIYLTGSSANQGVTPTQVFAITTGTGDTRTRVGPFPCLPSDPVFAFSTVAGTTLGVMGSRQNAP